MRLSVEIMLRGNNHVFTEPRSTAPSRRRGRPRTSRMILKGMLRAMARAQGPEAGEPQDGRRSGA